MIIQYPIKKKKCSGNVLTFTDSTMKTALYGILGTHCVDGEITDEEADTITYLPESFLFNNTNVTSLEDLFKCKNLQSINSNAFNRCTNIKGDLIIPSSVKQIGDFAFGFDNGLDGLLLIPNSVNKIDDRAFYRCNFSSIIIGGAGNPVDDLSGYNTNIFTYVPSTTIVTVYNTTGTGDSGKFEGLTTNYVIA